MTPAQQAQIARARYHIFQGWTDAQLREAGIPEPAIRYARTIPQSFQRWMALSDVQLPIDPQARAYTMEAMARAYVAGWQSAEDKDANS